MVFVSSQSVDRAPAALLIEALRRAGVAVEHSPRNPSDGEDSRWIEWYHEGLPATVGRSRSFVAVIDKGWDSSSWMAWEADEATRRRVSTFFWNPEGVRVMAAGMQRYLTAELPSEADAAVDFLLHCGAV